MGMILRVPSNVLDRTPQGERTRKALLDVATCLASVDGAPLAAPSLLVAAQIVTLTIEAASSVQAEQPVTGQVGSAPAAAPAPRQAPDGLSGTAPSPAAATVEPSYAPSAVARACHCRTSSVRLAIWNGALRAIMVPRTRGGRAGYRVRASDIELWRERGMPTTPRG